jgi:hypothetical protein
VRKLIIAGALLLVAGCGGTERPAEGALRPNATAAPTTEREEPQADRPGNPDVYRRIAKLTDCARLQDEFDTAETNHERDIARGRTDLAEIDTSYMTAADERMQQVGCY